MSFKNINTKIWFHWAATKVSHI